MRALSFKNHVKFYRLQKGLTRRDFAAKMEIRPATITAIEAEEYSISLELAWQIADFFGMPLTELFFRAGEEPQLRVLPANQTKGSIVVE